MAARLLTQAVMVRCSAVVCLGTTRLRRALRRNGELTKNYSALLFCGTGTLASISVANVTKLRLPFTGILDGVILRRPPCRRVWQAFQTCSGAARRRLYDVVQGYNPSCPALPAALL